MAAAVPATATANQVTYRVDMSVQRAFGVFDPDRGDTVLVSGTFSSPNWTTSSGLSAVPDEPDVFQGTFASVVPVGSWEKHKFIVNPGGTAQAGRLVWEDGNDRYFRVASTNHVLPVVFFNDVETSGTATQVTLRVSLEEQAAVGLFDPERDHVLVSADLINGGGLALSPLTNSTIQPLVWRGSFPVNAPVGASVSYRFAFASADGPTIWEDQGLGPGGSPNRQSRLTGTAVILPLADFNDRNPDRVFLAGADLSHLVFFEDRGAVYRVDDEPRDALRLLTDRGLNCVRLRLFTSSEAQATANPYNAINNLDYVVPLAARVKAAGLKLLLDFHYSDTWADPGHQTKPLAWANLGFSELVARVRAHSSHAVATLAAAGAMPDYVQLGNEITSGLLWPDGRVGEPSFNTPGQWDQLAQLLTAAAEGVRDAAGANMPKLIIHIAAGGNWNTTRWFFDRLEARAVPFDIIGQSYYPWWHGSLDSLRYTMQNTAERYGRPILIAETAFPWAGDSDFDGFPATPQGQIDFTVAMSQITRSLPAEKGMGILWWGAEYQAVPGFGLTTFNQRSFFGADGNQLPVVTAFGQLTRPVDLSMHRQGPALQLHWPLSGVGMQLQSTSNLTASSSWYPIETPVSYTNCQFQATVPHTERPLLLYGLRSP